ncbi:MAG: electron transport complex subunit RsxG [Magnetospirillum sp.]|nr:electron transport complex subunit RsxG [Magnetospirillum sp.]
MSKPTYIHAIILGAFCLGFGVMLAATDMVTAEPIAQRALEDKQNALGKVIPAAIHDNNPVQDTLVVKTHEGKDRTIYRATRGGKVTGIAYQIEGSGYAGEIRLMLAVDAEGKVLGVRALAHKETPGLGDKIEVAKTDWITRFTGLSLGNPVVDKWKVKKDGGQFDQFSGATITPRGVVKAIREGLEFFAENKTQLLETH